MGITSETSKRQCHARLAPAARLSPLTERDIDTLGELRAATDNFLALNHKEGWVMPMDCGGFNGSHHSYTLHKLAKRGLCDRMKLGSRREKGSCRYRMNDAGRKFLADLIEPRRLKRTAMK